MYLRFIVILLRLPVIDKNSGHSISKCPNFSKLASIPGNAISDEEEAKDVPYNGNINLIIGGSLRPINKKPIPNSKCSFLNEILVFWLA